MTVEWKIPNRAESGSAERNKKRQKEAKKERESRIAPPLPASRGEDTMSDMWAENEVYRVRIAELEAQVQRESDDGLRRVNLVVDQREAQRIRIAELEAANAICRTDIEALMTSCDKLEAENGTLNGQADRDKQTIIRLGFRIAELEAGRDRLKAALTDILHRCKYDTHYAGDIGLTITIIVNRALSDPSGE